MVTLVALEHYAAFRSVEAVADEKSAFVRSLSPNGLAILNFDDALVKAMADCTTGRTVTVGTTGGDYLVSDVATSPDGTLSFGLSNRGGAKLPLQTRLIGSFNWLSVAAAAATTLELGVSDLSVKDRVATFEPVIGRMSTHATPEGSRILLDTIKAPFYSVNLPLATLEKMASPKKTFILGQISDYAGNSDKKYRHVYGAAAKVADAVYFVGNTAHKARAPAADVSSGKFHAFADVRNLANHLKANAKFNEVIIVKSSRNLHLERLLLDRIDTVLCWAAECGVSKTCIDCGLFRRRFEEHGGRRSPSEVS